MIKGRGLLAKALAGIDGDEYLFYVNGISNSVTEGIPEDNFEKREIIYISKNISNRVFVYFSTALVNSTENYTRPYVLHKYKMECLTKDLFPNYIIVRASNLVGVNPWNEHTLFNFLYNSLKAGKEIHVIESMIRNILDVDDFVKLFNYYLKHYFQKNSTVDIVNPVSFNMGEILSEFEIFFSKTFIKAPVEDSIAYFQAPVSFSLSLAKDCNINLDNYLPSILKKYYPPID